MSNNSVKGSSVIILNQSNVDSSNPNNNSLTYTFPSSINLANTQIAVASISLYYSWSNVSTNLNNNKFSYNWTNIFSGTIVNNTMTLANIPSSVASLDLSNASVPYVYIVSKLSSNTYTVGQSLNSQSYTDIQTGGPNASFSVINSMPQITITTPAIPFMVGQQIQASPPYFTQIMGSNAISSITRSGNTQTLNFGNWYYLESATTSSNLPSDNGTTVLSTSGDTILYSFGTVVNTWFKCSLLNANLPTNTTIVSVNASSCNLNWSLPSQSISVSSPVNGTNFAFNGGTVGVNILILTLAQYNAANGLNVGMTISNPYFPAGTYIVSKSIPAQSNPQVMLSNYAATYVGGVALGASFIGVLTYVAPTGIIGSLQNNVLTISAVATNTIPLNSTITFTSGIGNSITTTLSSLVSGSYNGSSVFKVSFACPNMGLCYTTAPTFTGVINQNAITITNLVGPLYAGMVLTNAASSLGSAISIPSITPTIASGNIYSLAFGNTLTSVSTISPRFSGTLTNGVMSYSAPTNAQLYNGMSLVGGNIPSGTTMSGLTSQSYSAGTGNVSLNTPITGVSITTTYPVVIPDKSMMEIADINAYFQYQMILNGHYLINASSQNVFYMEFVVNPNQYCVSLNTYAVPLTLANGWKTPVANAATGALAWVSFPATTYNPVVNIPAGANFNQLIGFAAGFSTSPNLGNGTNISYLSTIIPQIQPNPSLLLTCSHISNILAIPSSVIHSITPLVNFGQLLCDRPPALCFNNMSGTTNTLKFQFTTSLNQSIFIQDPNMVIQLILREQSPLN